MTNPVQGPAREVSKTIAHNTLFNAAGRVWEAVLSVVLTAYIIRVLGEAGYGMWSLVAVLMSYATLFDVGVGSGFSKYIAERSARHGDAGVSAVVSAGFCFYALLGAVFLAVGWPAVDALLRGVLWLHPPETEAAALQMDGLHFLFRGALVLFVLNSCIAPLAAVPVGLQRMGLSNVLSAAAAVVKAVATVAFLETGYGVPGLLYANGAVLIFLAFSQGAVAWRLAPGLRVGFRQLDGATFSQLFHFGWRAQVARFSNIINFQTDRAVVWLAFGSLGLTGVYYLAEYGANKMRQLPGLLVSALVPAVSDLDARGDEERLLGLYLRSTKYMAVVAVPLAVYFLCAGDPLLRLLAGSEVAVGQAGWVMRILVVGYFFNLLPAPGVSVALGKGRADMQMKAGLISTGANIILTVLLYWQFGFYGIPVATTLGMALSTLWFFRAMGEVAPVALSRLFRECLLWPLLASVPGMVFCLAAQAWARGETGMVANGLAATAAAVLLGISYAACLGRMPYLDTFDVGFLQKTLRLSRVPGFSLLTGRARHEG
jgi:O-antigen/teichoic acid export membrane protein